jgi:small subunit ribosomal protein S17
MAKAKTTTETEKTKDAGAGQALAPDKSADQALAPDKSAGQALAQDGTPAKPRRSPRAPAAEATVLDATAAPAPVAQEATAPAGVAAAAAGRGRRQTKVGRVVSSKMNKTVIVTVENTTTHRLYHRYMKRTSKFAAHDAENRCQVGDVVEIVSSRPLSRTKRWRVREILKRAQ